MGAGFGLMALTSPAWALPVGIGMAVTGAGIIFYDTTTSTDQFDDVKETFEPIQKGIDQLNEQLKELDFPSTPNTDQGC